MIDRLVRLIFSNQRKDLRKSYIGTAAFMDSRFPTFIKRMNRFTSEYSINILSYRNGLENADKAILKGVSVSDEIKNEKLYLNINLQKSSIELMSHAFNESSGKLNSSLKSLRNIVNSSGSVVNNLDNITIASDSNIRLSNYLSNSSFKKSLDSYYLQLEQSIHDFRSINDLKNKFDNIFNEGNLFNASEFRAFLLFTYRQLLDFIRQDAERVYKYVISNTETLKNKISYLANENINYTAYLTVHFSIDEYRKANNIPDKVKLSFSEIRKKGNDYIFHTVHKPASFIIAEYDEAIHAEIYSIVNRKDEDIIRELYNFEGDVKSILIKENISQKPVLKKLQQGRYILDKKGVIKKS